MFLSMLVSTTPPKTSLSTQQFAQIGILRNPTISGSSTIFTENTFTAADSLKLSIIQWRSRVGDIIEQPTPEGTAKGYVVSFNEETLVLKYIQDRSLYYNPITYDNQDYVGISTNRRNYLSFLAQTTSLPQGFSGTVDTTFNGSTEVVGKSSIELGVEFTNGVAQKRDK